MLRVVIALGLLPFVAIFWMLAMIFVFKVIKTMLRDWKSSKAVAERAKPASCCSELAAFCPSSPPPIFTVTEAPKPDAIDAAAGDVFDEIAKEEPEPAPTHDEHDQADEEKFPNAYLK